MKQELPELPIALQLHDKAVEYHAVVINTIVEQATNAAVKGELFIIISKPHAAVLDKLRTMKFKVTDIADWNGVTHSVAPIKTKVSW